MRAAIEEAAQRLVDAGIASEAQLRGLSEPEVAELESRVRIKLPESYRDFLLRMGKSAGDFLIGTDFLFPKLLGLRVQADELLRESNSSTRLGPHHFVFAAHQGYQFLYFSIDGTNDPEVFRYLEGEEPELVAPSFSSWLLGCVDDEIAARS